MPRKNEYLDYLLEWLAPLGTITARSMFGGHCVYCNGIVFALVAANTLYLKVDDQTRPRFESLGLKPFRPFEEKPEVMQYYPPPAGFFEDPEARNAWACEAIATAHRAAAKKARKRTPNPRQK